MGGGCSVASEIDREIKTLREINDQREENVERMGVLNDRLRGLHDEYLRIDEDEQQLLADLEASPDEADKAALQLEARDLHERKKQLAEQFSHAQKDFEELRAEDATLRTRIDEELTETHKMFFEIAKHLTTLNTAAILVYLAAGETLSLPLWVALLFVVSLAGATVSMIATGLRWISPRPTRIGTFGLAVAISCFFVGLLYSVLHALLLP
jgi:FtsZ-binding cell division protein ZapB